MESTIYQKVFTMKFSLIIVLLLKINITSSQTPVNDLNWQIYFIEDFTAAIDWNKWQLPSGNWQPTREFWTSNNVVISDGNVIFSVDEFQTGKYHVGGLETKNINFPYGYYEIKWQVPQTTGRWLSWWLCCGVSGNDKWEELDFFENVDEMSNSIFHSNIHTTGVGCDFSETPNHVSNNMTLSQNVISVEWTPNVLIYYYNYVPVKEIFYDYCIPYGRQSKLYITPGISNILNPNLSLPSSTTVNYVKVWTLKKDLVPTTIQNNSQLTSFVYNLKKSISINATGNAISIPVGQKLTFRATDFISIVGDFTVPLGSELILFTHNEPNN